MRTTLLRLALLASLLALAGAAGAIPPEPCTWLGLPEPPCPI